MDPQKWGLWSWFWTIIRRCKVRTLAIFIFACLFSWLIVQLMFVWQGIIDEAVQRQYNVVAVIGLCIIVVIIIEPFTVILEHYTHNKLGVTALTEGITHTLQLDSGFHTKSNTKEMQREVERAVSATDRLYSMLFINPVAVQVAVAAYCGVYVLLHSRVVFAGLLVFAVFFLICNIKFGHHVAERKKAWNEADNKWKATILERLIGIESVAIHNMQWEEGRKIALQGAAVLAKENRLDWLDAMYDSVKRGAEFLPFLAGGLVFIPQVVAGDLSVGTLVLLMSFCTRFVSPISALGSNWQTYKKVQVDCQPLIDILNQEPQIVEGEQAVNAGELVRGIRFKNVFFEYPNQDREGSLAIDDLFIPAGSIIGIVGETGKARKSTIAKLLIRLYDPQQGRITYDDTPLVDLKLQSLRQEVYLVSQHAAMFSGTIRDFLNYGIDQPYPDRRLNEACDLACANFAISRLDHTISDGGENLSGGEKQRLTLARVYLRQPSVVILDEVTSAVDAPTEGRIMANLYSWQQRVHCLMIIIAHRLATVESANQILVMQDGRVTGQGSHDELMQKNDEYRRLKLAVA